jgi:elongation factor P hydroxylase
MSSSSYVDLNARSRVPEDSAVLDLIRCFNERFLPYYNTCLVLGDDEPVYLPADEQCLHHRIIFAHGFFASALHEIAHWCIAGEERRKLVDFGYWYAPDGRNASQQQLFESVEVKPQALEWILSKAAGRRFRVSADNLNGVQTDAQPFKRAVYDQVLHYCEVGLSQRQERVRELLAREFGGVKSLRAADYCLTEI